MEDENSCFRVRFSVEKETLKKKTVQNTISEAAEYFRFSFHKIFKKTFFENCTTFLS